MKWRFTPLLLLTFLVASSACWADTVLVGSIDLNPNGIADTLLLTNTTGAGASASANTVANAETISGLSLTINGSGFAFNTAQEPVAAHGGTLDFGDSFSSGQITSLNLTGNLNGPTTVTIGSGAGAHQVQINLSSLSATYSNVSGLPDFGHIDVFAQTVAAPEPAVVPLFGLAVWFIRPRRVTG